MNAKLGYWLGFTFFISATAEQSYLQVKPALENSESELELREIQLPLMTCVCGHATLENIRGEGRRPGYPNQDSSLFKMLSPDQIVFGVFDGHGEHGGAVSNFVSNTLPDLLYNEPAIYQSAKVLLRDAYFSLQEELEPKDFAWASGTTSLIGVLEKDQLVVANTGDSRLLVARNGEEIFSTEDHKPGNLEEFLRITQTPGTVFGSYVYDIDRKHGLAVSRSIGDIACHRNHVVIANPDVDTVTVHTGDFIISASDGLFDVMDNDEVIAFVNDLYKAGVSINKISKALVEEARHRGSKDDITVMIIMIS